MKSNVDLSKGLVFFEPFTNIDNVLSKLGTISGTIELGVDKGHQCGSFDGVNDYINYTSVLRTSSTTRTLVCWIKRAVITSSSSRIISRGSAETAAGQSYQLNLTTSKPTLLISNGTTTNSKSTTNAISDTNWHFIVAKWDGSNLSISLDNSAFETTSQTVVCQNNSSHNMYIGCDGATANKFNGSISDVRIYNRALSAQEVSLLYKQGLNKMPNNNVGSSKLLFNLSASPSGIIKDLTGNTTLTSTNVSVVKQGSIYAMKFDGSTSKIDTGSDWINTKACTISVWIKPYSSGEGNYGRIIENAKLIIFMNLTRVSASSDGAVTLPTTALNSVPYSMQTMFVVSRTSSGIVNLYINGVLSGTANQSSGTPVAGTTNIIVGNSSNQANTFNGLISSVQVWDRVFTAEEVSQVFNAQRRLYGV